MAMETRASKRTSRAVLSPPLIARKRARKDVSPVAGPSGLCKVSQVSRKREAPSVKEILRRKLAKGKCSDRGYARQLAKLSSEHGEVNVLEELLCHIKKQQTSQLLYRVFDCKVIVKKLKIPWLKPPQALSGEGASDSSEEVFAGGAEPVRHEGIMASSAQAACAVQGVTLALASAQTATQAASNVASASQTTSAVKAVTASTIPAAASSSKEAAVFTEKEATAALEVATSEPDNQQKSGELESERVSDNEGNSVGHGQFAPHKDVQVGDKSSEIEQVLELEGESEEASEGSEDSLGEGLTVDPEEQAAHTERDNGSDVQNDSGGVAISSFGDRQLQHSESTTACSANAAAPATEVTLAVTSVASSFQADIPTVSKDAESYVVSSAEAESAALESATALNKVAQAAATNIIMAAIDAAIAGAASNAPVTIEADPEATLAILENAVATPEAAEVALRSIAPAQQVSLQTREWENENGGKSGEGQGQGAHGGDAQVEGFTIEYIQECGTEDNLEGNGEDSDGHYEHGCSDTGSAEAASTASEATLTVASPTPAASASKAVTSTALDAASNRPDMGDPSVEVESVGGLSDQDRLRQATVVLERLEEPVLHMWQRKQCRIKQWPVTFHTRDKKKNIFWERHVFLPFLKEMCKEGDSPLPPVSAALEPFKWHPVSMDFVNLPEGTR